MALTKKQINQEAEFERLFKAAYIRRLNGYLSAKNEIELVKDINQRYNQDWTEQQVADFLNNFFDDHGALIEINGEIENPIYNHLKTASEIARLQKFFDENNNDLNTIITLKETFIFDAIHQHLVGDLQTTTETDNSAVSKLTDFYSTTLDRDSAGTEAVQAATHIKTWSDCAAAEFYRNFYDKKNKQGKKIFLFHSILNNLTKITLSHEDLDKLPEINNFGEITRIFNKATLIVNNQRAIKIKKFYDTLFGNSRITQLNDNKSLATEIIKFNNLNQFFLIRGKINPKLLEILNEYGVPTKDLLFLIRDETVLANYLVFEPFENNKLRTVRAYLSEIHSALTNKKDEFNKPLFSQTMINNGLLFATSVPLAKAHVDSQPINNLNSTSEPIGPIIKLLNKQLYLYATEPKNKKAFHNFFNLRKKPKASIITSLARVISESAATSALGVTGAIIGGLLGSFFLGMGAVPGALIGSGIFSAIAAIGIGSIRSTSQSRLRKASGFVIASGVSSTFGFVSGAILGSMFIPIPVGGAVIGGIFGGVFGAFASGLPMLGFKLARVTNQEIFSRKPNVISSNVYSNPSLMRINSGTDVIENDSASRQARHDDKPKPGRSIFESPEAEGSSHRTANRTRSFP